VDILGCLFYEGHDDAEQRVFNQNRGRMVTPNFNEAENNF
jgi:hypothetical protein